MKTLIKLSFLCLMLVFVSKAYSQSATSAVIKYSGPANTDQLTALLNTTDSTTYPLIVRLPSAMKTSIETYLEFSTAGLPMGMSGTDSNISYLNSHPTAYGDLMTEILDQQVVAHTYGSGPTITDITMTQFEEMTAGIIYDGGGSLCVNCPAAPPTRDDNGNLCCGNPPGNGCVDEVIKISGNWYSVDQ